MSAFHGQQLVEVCVCISVALEKYNEEHPQANGNDLQALFSGRVGPYLWRECLNHWAYKQHKTLRNALSNDLWNSLTKHFDLIRMTLSADSKIDVLISGWQEDVSRSEDERKKRNFLDKLFGNHENPMREGVPCRVRFHVPGLHGTVGNLILPSSQLKFYSHRFLRNVNVITANPEFLLVQTLLRLARELPSNLGKSSSWIELRLLHRLQLSVEGKGEAVQGFVMSQQKIDIACSQSLPHQEYFELQKRLGETLRLVSQSQDNLKEEIAKLDANRKSLDASSFRRERDQLNSSASICRKRLDALLYFSQFFQGVESPLEIKRPTISEQLTFPAFPAEQVNVHKPGKREQGKAAVLNLFRSSN